MLRSRGDQRSFDLVIFSLYLSLIALGVLMVFSVSQREIERVGLLNSIAGKQMIWVGIAMILFLVIFLIDWKSWQTFAYFIYAFTLLLLVGVLLFGTEIKGATSWYSFGGFSIQPSELAKFGTALAVSSFLGTYNLNLKDVKTQITAFAIFFMPVILVLMQPDAGSALVFLSFTFVLYREGLSVNYYLTAIYLVTLVILGLVVPPVIITIGLLVCAIYFMAGGIGNPINWRVGVIFWAIGSYILVREEFYTITLIANGVAAGALAIAYGLKNNFKTISFVVIVLAIGVSIAFTANYGFNNILRPHQQERINVWLQPSKCDPRGALYNVLQSKLAISSGGIEGKGFLNGEITRLNYVPEQATDFIFCTIGEEHGFIGSAATILIFMLLMYRIIVLAERQRSNFSRIYAYSVVGIIFVHFFVNIGMTMGIMPIIGIPLPLLSKGGSSLLGFTLLIGVLLKFDSHRYQI
jgi:rod shape determining protein RodA